MFKENTFKDKVALVTGGRSGIGYQIAKDLLQMGAKVVICSRKEEPLMKAKEELAAFGEVSATTCDIRKEEDIGNLVQFIKEKYSRLDLLVNNAGGQFPTLAEYTMAINFFLPQKSGNIVNIIAQIHRGFPGMVHTGAARAGVENMTKTLALEWSHANIRINCVAPGTIESSGLSTYPKPVQDSFDAGRKANPLKRFGTVEDISNAVCFLSSPLSAYITGITMYVDGAAHLNTDKMGLPNVLKSFLK